MARIRTIKPEYWSSPEIGSLELHARLLFIAMWNWADDTGRGSANPGELLGFAFPNDEDLSPADIRRMLGGIRRAFGVEFYKVGGRPFYFIPSWDKHQKIDKRSGSKYPGPDEGAPFNPDPDDPTGNPSQPSDQPERNTSEGSAEPSAESAESPPNPRRSSGAGTGEQGNRGTGEQGDDFVVSSEIAPRPSDPPPSTTDRPDVERVCTHLAERMIGNGCKPPTIGKRWRDAARLMLDRDRRAEADVHAAIDWCQDDEFWRVNILSLPKLREKYDQLSLQAQRGQRGGNVVHLNPGGHQQLTGTDARVAGWAALADQLNEQENR